MQHPPKCKKCHKRPVSNRGQVCQVCRKTRAGRASANSRPVTAGTASVFERTAPQAGRLVATGKAARVVTTSDVLRRAARVWPGFAVTPAAFAKASDIAQRLTQVLQ